MYNLIQKFKDKNFVQDILIEIVADLIMLIIGIIIGYYLKAMLF